MRNIPQEFRLWSPSLSLLLAQAALTSSVSFSQACQNECLCINLTACAYVDKKQSQSFASTHSLLIHCYMTKDTSETVQTEGESKRPWHFREETGAGLCLVMITISLTDVRIILGKKNQPLRNTLMSFSLSFSWSCSQKHFTSHFTFIMWLISE